MTTVTRPVTDPAMVAAAIGTGTAIEALGATWMLHPEQSAASTDAGFAHPFAGYFAGRAGVPGPVEAPVVAATLAVFEPGVVAAMWKIGTRTHPPTEAALLYTRQATEWADRHLGGATELDRFCELTDRLIDAAPAAGLPLFAGWRDLPRVGSGPGRALQNAVVLREFQGGVHISALTAAGITAVEAHLLNKGAEYCAFFGWEPPFPDVAALAPAYQAVRDQTHARMASVMDRVLSLDEAEELTRIAAVLNRTLD